MANRKSSLRSRLLVSAAALAMIPLSAAAQEQEEEEDMVTEDEEIVLGVVTATGIRGSIADSLAAKRYSDSVIEAISAEDIGKLPDLSIADALARLPGVTAQRVRGRSQTVSIRGLGPDFSLALLNGREIVSASSNRGIEFDQFPSELIAQGIVYKTPDARLNATGVAGAVDLRTVRPLEYDEQKLNVSGKYVQGNSDGSNPDFDDNGYRLFGSVIDKSDDGTIGWAVALTIQSNPTTYLSRELKALSQDNRVDSSDPPVQVGTGIFYPSDNPRSGVVSRDFERTSLAGTLQFEPNDQVSVVVDGFFTDTEDKGIFRGVETPLAAGWAGTVLDTSSLSGTRGGVTSKATFNEIYPFLRTDEEGNSAEIQAIGVNVEYDYSDRLTLIGDLSTSSMSRSDIDYESYAGTTFNKADATNTKDTVTYTVPSNGEYSIRAGKDYTDRSVVFLTNPYGWGGANPQMGYLKEPKVEDELMSIRLEADYTLETPFFTNVIGGLLYSSREKSFDSNEYFLRKGSNTWSNNRHQIPTSSIVGITDSGGIGLNIIAYNTAGLVNSRVYSKAKNDPNTRVWNVEETVTTFYAMGNVDHIVNQVPMRGNIGLQIVSTKQSSTAESTILIRKETQSFDHDYTNFLPSVNLNFDISNDSIVRVALAQTLTRPRLDQLAAGRTLSFDNVVCPDTTGGGTNNTSPDMIPDSLTDAHNPPDRTCFNLSGGNPKLEPYKSLSFDLAFERYFDDVTAVSFAVFHKSLDSWVWERTRIINATDLIVNGGGTKAQAFLTANPTASQTKTNGQDNSTDGTIIGFEATIRMSLDDYLPEEYAGLGFNASYTYADGSIDHPNGKDEIDIPGYSETVWSWDVYYENHGWRARLNSRYRSDFLSEVLEYDHTLTQQSADEEMVFDLQVGYTWDEGQLEGFSVNFEAFNLGNEPFVTQRPYGSGNTFPNRHELYGSTYNITVSKKF